MSAQTSARKASDTSLQSIGFNLAALVLFAALLAVGFAYALDALSRTRTPAAALAASGPRIEKNIFGQKLNVPLAWMRYPERQGGNFTERLDLRLPLALGANGLSVPVDVTLLPRTRTLTSAQLLDGVYLHKFDTTQLSGPVGLIGKPLKGGEGFDGETVWYDPLSPNPFVAKCMAPVTGEAAPHCLRILALPGGIAVMVGFDQALLAHWESFDTALSASLEEMGLTLQK